MTSSTAPFGLSCALATPFTSTHAVDLPRLVAHVRRVLDNGAGSVTVFGTTGEGASLGSPARAEILAALSDAGLDLRRQVAGAVASASLHEAIDQARQLLEADAKAVLLTPPFYFKGVSDEGLFRWFAHVFDKLGAQARDVILYNIPSVTQVPLSVDLVGRLREAFPQVVLGVKDSSGDWAHSQALLAAHSDLQILIGDERHLAQAMRLGATGSISGLANVCPGEMLAMIAERRDDPRIVDLVETVLRHPVTPAVKALVAHRTGDVAWLAVRPPLLPLERAEADRLGAAFDELFASVPA